MSGGIHHVTVLIAQNHHFFSIQRHLGTLLFLRHCISVYICVCMCVSVKDIFHILQCDSNICYMLQI